MAPESHTESAGSARGSAWLPPGNVEATASTFPLRTPSPGWRGYTRKWRRSQRRRQVVLALAFLLTLAGGVGLVMIGASSGDSSAGAPTADPFSPDRAAEAAADRRDRREARDRRAAAVRRRAAARRERARLRAAARRRAAAPNVAPAAPATAPAAPATAPAAPAPVSSGAPAVRPVAPVKPVTKPKPAKPKPDLPGRNPGRRPDPPGRIG